MLEILRTLKSAPHHLSPPKIFGVGNAGVNLIDRFTIERSSQVETVAVNTDRQSLVSSVADFKIPLGEKVTRGLGTGGDPVIGKEAAEESQAAFQSSIEGAGWVILCAGLGGGTGSGTLPVMLELARAAGVLTAVIATLPFQFEGARRRIQAQDALEKIRSSTDILLTFENDRMLENAQSEVGIGETFAKSDLFLTHAVLALTRLISGSGPLQLTAGDLATILHPSRGVSLFGFGQAEGPDRARHALDQALQNPLLDRGRLLEEAHRLLIHIDGSCDLLLSEVQTIVQSISSTCAPTTHILLGIHATAPSYTHGSAPIAVSVLGICLELEKSAIPEKTLPRASLPSPQLHFTPSLSTCSEISSDPEPASEAIPPQVTHWEKLLPLPPIEPPASQERTSVPQEPRVEETLLIPSPPSHSPPTPSPPLDAPMESAHLSHEEFLIRKNSLKPRQEVLKFEPIARGRFEKSEPTIVEGEDIDVPTFLRLKIKLK